MPQSNSKGCCFGDGPNNLNAEFDEGQPRKCTDLPWLFSYVLFCCFMIIIAAFAFVYGNPSRLFNGIDSFGNICGTVNENLGNFTFSGLDMTEKPYLLFFDLQNMDESTKICVSKCPEERIGSEKEIEDYFHRTNVSLCRYDYVFPGSNPKGRAGVGDDIAIKADFSHRLCPKTPIYPSIPVLKRCIPKPEELANQRFFFNVYSYLNALNSFKQVLGDVAVTWHWILFFTLISFVLSFMMVILLQFMTWFISYMIMMSSCILSLGLTIYLWMTYSDIKMILDKTPQDRILEESAKNERAFLVYSILSTIFTVALIAIAIYLRKRVTLIVKLFREGGRALWAMPCLIVQPVITYISLTIFFCIWLLVVLCLATADYPNSRRVFLEINAAGSYENTSEVDGMLGDDPNVPRVGNVTLERIAGMTFIEYDQGAWVKYLWWVYLIGLVWVSEFILSCQQMVIASSISTWYFSRDRKKLRCVIYESIVKMVKYHIGSVVFGSLIITLVKIPRLLLAFSQRVMRRWEKCCCISFLYRCCTGCLNCFENTLKYIHHNAFTVIAIQGVDFCTASKIAFAALMQNALQISLINSIGDFVLFLSKCIVASITGLIALIIFKQNQTLYFYAIPTLIVVIFAYFVAHCVISVFEMTCDTLFLCFLEDYNMNKDNVDGEKKYYAPESLLKYMTEDAIDSVAPGRRETYTKKRSLPNGENGNGQQHPESVAMIPTENNLEKADNNMNA